MRLSGTKTSSIHQYRGLGDQLWDLGGARPSLDLQFSATKNLIDSVSGQSLVTFTRASSGTYVGSDGVLKTATTNEPRFDHNPTTGESLGLLVEEQRTNSIRNNTMVGAVAGTPGTLPTNYGISGLGTLSQQVVEIGASGGVSYIDLRLSGTTSTTQASIRLEASNGATGTNGQTFSFSCWLARIAGSLTNITGVLCNCNIYDATIAYLATTGFVGFDSTIQPTSFVRRSGTATIAQATAAFIQPQIVLTFTSGVAIDITLRIGLPQLEQGAFATSVIPTSGAAATRSADVASITGTNFSSWYRQDEGTVFAEGLVPPGLANFPMLYQASDGTVNNSFSQYFHTSGYYGNVRSGNAVQGDPGVIASPVVGAAYRSAFAVRQDNAVNSANGALGTPDTALLMPLNQSEVRVGASRTGASAINTTIRRLTYWPARLANSTLQQITQ